MTFLVSWYICWMCVIYFDLVIVLVWLVLHVGLLVGGLDGLVAVLGWFWLLVVCLLCWFAGSLWWFVVVFGFDVACGFVFDCDVVALL